MAATGRPYRASIIPRKHEHRSRDYASDLRETHSVYGVLQKSTRQIRPLVFVTATYLWTRFADTSLDSLDKERRTRVDEVTRGGCILEAFGIFGEKSVSVAGLKFCKFVWGCDVNFFI